MNTEKLEKTIGYSFKDGSLLNLALTHSSYTNEHKLGYFDCNERLEFLGDAVLELASSEFLYEKYRNRDEGDLTRIRASLVCESSLAEVAREISLGSYISMGKGEEATGGRDRDSMLSDALEAVLGAIYLDGGFTNAKEFVYNFIMKDMDRKQLFFDSKTILQERVQGHIPGEIHYEVIGTEGPEHDRTFTSQVLIGGTVYGVGSGHTKKAAEQQAAYEAILQLDHRRDR